jgi:hypothetical protein
MTPTTKAESTPDLVAAIDRLERESDTCYVGLRLLTHEWKFAAWLSLAECARRLESSLTPQQYGSGQHKIIVMNLARASAQMCKFARAHGKRSPRAPSSFRWSAQLAEEAAAAFQVAWEYSMFCVDFPAWHKNLYAAELVGAGTIRFHSGTSQLARRVSAYQKGIRPAAAQTKHLTEEMPSPTQKLRELFEDVMRRSKARGVYRVKFGSTDRLRTELARLYAERLSGVFRRYPDISVGRYTLGQFRSFYAGLLALVSAHEHLCFLWAQSNGLPLESVNILYPRLKWIKLIAEYSGLTGTEIESILPDLIFGDSQVQDLQVMPFVPLADDNSLLAVAPAFPLASNWEENILRVCSYLRPTIYSETSFTKEDEMRDQLQRAITSPRRVIGPVKLGKGVPDLDLLFEDRATQVLVLAELKWPRKPYAPREIVERDSEIRKGVSQIKAIKKFLSANPRFLVDRNYVAQAISEYREVQYCVISRDHLIASDDLECPIYSYDAFEAEMASFKDTSSGLTFLNSMDWLPVEGKDYTCQWITNRAAGVTILSELFLLKAFGASIATSR